MNPDSQPDPVSLVFKDKNGKVIAKAQKQNAIGPASEIRIWITVPNTDVVETVSPEELDKTKL